MEELNRTLESYLKTGIPEEKGLGPKYNKVIQMDITGDKNFYMEIKGGKTLTLVEGMHPKPDATIISDKDTMLSIAAGQNPVQAMMQGKIKVKGAMMELMKLQGLIFPST
jgi:putative sterol carrier protein